MLEVAPGTGQATVPLGERGWSVTAVELGGSPLVSDVVVLTRTTSAT